MMIEAFQTDTFVDNLRKLDGSYRKIADKLIKEIIQGPMRNSEIMQVDYEGLRKQRKGRIRVLYAYCRDCRERNDQLKRGCLDCEERKDDSIIFFQVGLRGQLY